MTSSVVRAMMVVFLVTVLLVMCSLSWSAGPGSSSSWPLWTRRTVVVASSRLVLLVVLLLALCSLVHRPVMLTSWPVWTRMTVMWHVQDWFYWLCCTSRCPVSSSFRRCGQGLRFRSPWFGARVQGVHARGDPTGAVREQGVHARGDPTGAVLGQGVHARGSTTGAVLGQLFMPVVIPQAQLMDEVVVPVVCNDTCPGPAVHSGGAAGAAHHQGHLHPCHVAEFVPHGSKMALISDIIF